MCLGYTFPTKPLHRYSLARISDGSGRSRNIYVPCRMCPTKGIHNGCVNVSGGGGGEETTSENTSLFQIEAVPKKWSRTLENYIKVKENDNEADLRDFGSNFRTCIDWGRVKYFFLKSTFPIWR